MRIVKLYFLTILGDFNISPVLRKTNATVISNAECADSYDTFYDGNFCVSTVDGHGTCNVIPAFDGIAFLNCNDLLFNFYN